MVRIAAVAAFSRYVDFPDSGHAVDLAENPEPGFQRRFLILHGPDIRELPDVLEGRFLGYLGNSVVVSVIATVLTLVFGTMCAYRFRDLGFPAVRRSRWVRCWSGPFLPRCWRYRCISFSLRSISTGFRPDDFLHRAQSAVYDLAALRVYRAGPDRTRGSGDGRRLRPFRLFFTLILPLLKPGLAAAAIFTFRIAWNELVLASILTNRTSRTLPYGVYLFITDVGIDWGQLMAAGMLVALPPLIFTFVAAQQIITGLTAGAVKG